MEMESKADCKQSTVSSTKTLESKGTSYKLMELFLTFLLFLTKVLYFVAHPIFVYASKGKKKSLPPIKNDLLKISATDLARKIRRKELSSVEICKAYVDRVKEVNPILNAVVEDRFLGALKEAKAVDDYLTKCALNEDDLEKIKPLLGVPLTVKESCSLQGMSYTGGLLSRAGYKAETDGELVAKLKTSGAIPLLVSNTPEICAGLESFNYVTGLTNNPYDTTCTSGGSSGGEGALLGAGASVIGLGSDIAGSIRVPAAFNGVFGHKPTARIVSIKGHFPYCHEEKFKDCLVLGPLTRYAEDLRLMMRVLIGDKLATQLKLNQKVDLSKINVFFMEDNGSVIEPPVQTEIKDAVRSAVKYLKTSSGATVKEHKFKEFKNAIQICGKDIFSIKDLPNPLKGENANLLTEIFKCVCGQSEYTPNLLYFLTLLKIFDNLVSARPAEVAQLRNEVKNHLGDNGVLICPTTSTSASKHHEFYFTSSSCSYLVLANSLGLPATSVPCGLDGNGMPIGIQIMASPNQDRLCLAVAEELEKHFGGWIPPK